MIKNLKINSRILKDLVILWAFCFALLPRVKAQDIPAKPNPARLVNDFVGQFSADEINRLEQKLVAFDDSTSSQISVVIVHSVEPSDMNSYAVKLGREWGIGNEGRNNGILMLWATDDRKVYIATGYGLEGALPDAYAKRIVEQVIIPHFRNGDFFGGIDAGTDAVIGYISGEYTNDLKKDSGGDFPFMLVLAIVFLLIWLLSRNRGGGGGGSRSSSSAWPYTTYTGWGNHSGSWGSGGGGWSGGGGGGFGGFGGGSFGGGGAGGSY